MILEYLTWLFSEPSSRKSKINMLSMVSFRLSSLMPS
ncbi:hypothetical protein AWRI1631_45230 [Saccharomyces cerevisiae AWRI1631]|uniref:Uncharacterized protein n=1 Tax=Saccharomyces cerevisiae (strain AWRI1631) TaxID=545124 RepID=B5VGI9_YEAS6|nr:hypothetical protein AWRI1631_45230 [Saccharomyces cerevisiae AWRI1631]